MVGFFFQAGVSPAALTFHSTLTLGSTNCSLTCTQAAASLLEAENQLKQPSSSLIVGVRDWQMSNRKTERIKRRVSAKFERAGCVCRGGSVLFRSPLSSCFSHCITAAPVTEAISITKELADIVVIHQFELDRRIIMNCSIFSNRNYATPGSSICLESQTYVSNQ